MPYTFNRVRSAFHIGSGLLGLLFIEIFSPINLIGVALFFTVGWWIAELLKFKSPKMNAWIMKPFTHIAIESEYETINSGTWFVTALFILSLFQNPVLEVIGVTILTFADPLAVYIGCKYGKRIIYQNKSLEGSLVFFCMGVFSSSLMIGILYPAHFNLVIFFVASFVGTLAELYGNLPNDNFTIPVSCGIAVHFMSFI